MAKLTCISADSHVIEPGDLWLNYIDPKYRERAPRLVHGEAYDHFVCEGVAPLPVGVLASAGVPAHELDREGRFETHIRRSAWDPDARLIEIESDGVQGEVLYPTVSLTHFAIQDIGLKRACFRAYNDWAADFCKGHPDRFKAVGLVAIEDVEGAVAELERCRALGLVGGAIALHQDQDHPYSDPVYDPFWAAAESMEMPVSLHIFTASPEGAPKRKRDITDGIVEPVWIQRALGQMLFAGVFERFPRLKVVSVESDAGWLPYFLERIDYIFERRQNLYPMNLSRKMLPSEMVRRAARFTFLRDRVALVSRDLIGVETLLWSSDYPHNGSTWPKTREVIDQIMEGVPPDERHRILASNAAALYGFAV